MTEVDLYSLQFFDEFKPGYLPPDAQVIITLVLPGKERDYVDPAGRFDEALSKGLKIGGTYCFPTLLVPSALELWYVEVPLLLVDHENVHPLVPVGGSPHMFRLLAASAVDRLSN